MRVALEAKMSLQEEGGCGGKEGVPGKFETSYRLHFHFLMYPQDMKVFLERRISLSDFPGT